MSAYEQRIEPPDKSWQYLLFAAEPYETIAFKVCSLKIVYKAFSVCWFSVSCHSTYRRSKSKSFNRLSQKSGKCK